MSIHKAYIVDAVSGEVRDAELHDDVAVDVLLDIEDQWTPERQKLRSKLRALGITADKWPESLHWNWERKSLCLALGDPDDFRVMGVRWQTVWEAAMVTLCKDHVALRAPDTGKPIVYIDYLEVAPWNWTVDKVQTRRFKAAGTTLMRAAIAQSYAKGWDGRVGLHALPQATAFYVAQGFQFVKNDPSKQSLPYYELSAAEAVKYTGRR